MRYSRGRLLPRPRPPPGLIQIKADLRQTMDINGCEECRTSGSLGQGDTMVRLPVALQALLIAAAFCLLFVAPAAAHPGEGHGSVTGRTVISDAPVDRVSPDLKEPEARDVVSASTRASSPCCCAQGGNSTNCGCSSSCASASCGYGSALACTHGVNLPVSAKRSLVPLRHRLLSGSDLDPGERPPRL